MRRRSRGTSFNTKRKPIRSRRSLAGVLHSGVRVAGRTPEGGRIVVTLYRGNRRIGSGAIVARRGGSYAGRVRMTRAGERLLRRQPRSIVVEAQKSAGGTDATTVSVTR